MPECTQSGRGSGGGGRKRKVELPTASHRAHRPRPSRHVHAPSLNQASGVGQQPARLPDNFTLAFERFNARVRARARTFEQRGGPFGCCLTPACSSSRPPGCWTARAHSLRGSLPPAERAASLQLPRRLRNTSRLLLSPLSDTFHQLESGSLLALCSSHQHAQAGGPLPQRLRCHRNESCSRCVKCCTPSASLVDWRPREDVTLPALVVRRGRIWRASCASRLPSASHHRPPAPSQYGAPTRQSVCLASCWCAQRLHPLQPKQVVYPASRR